ncbi:MAG: [protein-PII] uridylyltransferase [Halieaceae bacterium]|nr:[protein-PII] uridylyltransferase [Halieaceae bacterium]
MNACPGELLDREALASACDAEDSPVATVRAACERANAWLNQEFRNGRDIGELLQLRAAAIDEVMRLLWDRFDWDEERIALVAVGGYGRGELHPQSDIDLLILVGEDAEDQHANIEGFVTQLWDIKLDIGHAVRTITDCTEAAQRDITICTTLMESRLIAGSAQLREQMKAAVSVDKIWPSAEFFRAKWDEQKARHAKYADTEYNLEPNVKGSPGGLRDIQTISWIALRHYRTGDPESLKDLGFLTGDELNILLRGRDFLWRVRWALHMVTGREENRLLFDHQRELARLFGFEDSDMRLAVEQFMQRYYRAALAISQLNEVLMQHFDQVILRSDAPEQVIDLNTRFQIRNGLLEVKDDEVFTRTPSALLELFLLCAQDERIEGVFAATIRLAREHRDLIDAEFRADPRNRRLFMEILRSSNKMALQLRRMNRYGILGKYLPEFGRIVGQMQHDLFHIYTVDAHTLEVVKNMRRLLYPEDQERFPVTSRVAARLPKIELLYIAGLYHDIAKGRGGDHSELGAVDAREFCEKHGVNERDTDLVVWLVENHLLMSGTAQRKDITDPEVINDFAATVGSQTYLDYLLALTVADINATNPTLWNAWRGSLLRQLYTETRRALQRGLDNQVGKAEAIADTQRRARERLEDRGFLAEEVEALWAEAGEDYFLREHVDDIVWHTEAIAQHYDKSTPLVLVKPDLVIQNDAATQIFIHARNQNYLFSVVTAALEQLHLSVLDARLYNSIDGMAMDTFYVLDESGASIANDSHRLRQIVEFLTTTLTDRDRFPEVVARRTPRAIRYFAMPTETSMYLDPVKNVSVLEVTTPDRPGLLARIGRIFFEHGIVLQAAKITTLGERVEDVFFVTDADHEPLEDPDLVANIRSAICKELDEQAAA